MRNEIARYIVSRLRGFETEQQLDILDRLQEKNGIIALKGDEETAAADIERKYFFNVWILTDAINELRDALTDSRPGHCDACGKLGPMRHYEGSSGETDQCYFGCEE